MVFQLSIRISTRAHGEMHDLTDVVEAIVRKSGISTGMVNVSVVGSTAAVSTIEFEPGLKKDLPELLDRLVPPSRSYGHEQTWHDGNGHSHLQATLLGPAVTLPVSDGKISVGTWQQLYLIELDIKPRTREAIVTVYGE
ncbi:MAG: secondary thiamine-phosphate synthase enzyme YjbQ [Bacteroidetes bacterium]|nr:secondary thiamine-phosphate synthase enzyme YjbQ [Bacteroidota bacterium]